MPTIYVGPGDTVFVIMRSQVFEGEIVKLLSNNKMTVSYRVYRERIDVGDFEYGRNLFMTRAKAEKINGTFKKAHYGNYTFRESSKVSICQSCGVPINEFGNCRCTI